MRNRRKFSGGEKVVLRSKVYRICKDGHLTDGTHTFYKAARGSNVDYVRSDRAIRA
jgi:hypothetical protein